jgi:alanine dehydrogenase
MALTRSDRPVIMATIATHHCNNATVTNQSTNNEVEMAIISISQSEQMKVLTQEFLAGLEKIHDTKKALVAEGFLNKFHEGEEILKMGLEKMAETAMTAVKTGNDGKEKGLIFINLCNSLAIADKSMPKLLKLNEYIIGIRDKFLNEIKSHLQSLKKELKKKKK